MTRIRSEADAAIELTQLEVEYGLWSLRVYGFSPWRLVRFAVGIELQNLPFSIDKLSKTALVRSCLRSLVDMTRVHGKHKFAVKSFTSALRTGAAEAYEDIYFESLLQKFSGGLRLYSLNADGYDSRKLTWLGPNVDTTLILVIGAFLARIFPVRGNDEVFRQIAVAIGSRLPNSSFSISRVRRVFSSFWWQSKMYRWLLYRFGIETIFVADSGERAILKAAHEIGCRFVELQHGVFTVNHPDALPLLPHLHPDDPGLLTPDIVAVYGNRWADMHRNTLLGKHNRIKPAGASFMDQFRLKRALSKPPKDVLKILVTTQGLAREQLIQLLRDFLDICTSSYNLYIKLHPIFDSSPKPYIEVLGRDSRVTIVPGHLKPSTHSLLAGCSLHVSISSACHYDAIGLKIPTIILALPNHEVVLDLVNMGHALLVHSGSQLAKIVDTRTWIPVSAELSDDFFAANFADNLSSWIIKT